MTAENKVNTKDMIVEITNDDKQRAKELLEPILTVFGGEDGGAAFSKLRHQLLPEIAAKARISTQFEDMLKMISQFSKLCEVIQK